MTNPIWRMGAAELAAAIRSRQLKSREAVEAHFARIRAVNPKVNAITVTLEEDALAAADAADAALAAGRVVGPLHGVPFTVKENIDLAGSATTHGLVVMKDQVPPVDAPQISQLRAAGAIPIARTNLPDFGLRWHTDNDLRGATLNPWDPSRTPGGSSGGEAAALATGMTPLGMGNDIGGSLRWPSQCCGTAAIRPSRGRVADHSAGATIDRPASFQLMTVEGPMARHVRDLELALACMSGPDARDPWWTPAPLYGPPVPKRVAVTLDPAGAGIDPAVAAAVRSAARALADAGYEVDEVDPPRVAEARDLWEALWLTELRVSMWPLMQLAGSSDIRQFLDRAIAGAPQLDLLQYVECFRLRAGIARDWTLFHERYPLVLGPVSTQQPFAVGWDLAAPEAVRQLFANLSLVVAVNLLGLPSVALPVGLAGGLPQGVQLIGDRFREDLCLDAARAVEERVGTITPIDPRPAPPRS